MAQAYFDHQRHEMEAVFHLFFRRNPRESNWSVAAGIDDALNFVAHFSISSEAIDYLRSLQAYNRPVFSEDFLLFLATTKAKVNIAGVAEGQVVFPNEPLLRVSGPLFLCQLLETPLLNIINFQTLIATKASRVKMAAGGKHVMEFGLRRAQGFDGAVSATRAAFVGGIDSTSNVWAAKHFAVATSGTQAHSFIMSYGDEQQAFADLCASFKDSTVLLIDTYDALKGIDNAVLAFKKLAASGHRPFGIRLDSGDLAGLSRQARAALDRAGFADCKIIASGDLDEYAIEKLEQDHAPIDIYGVGTRLITAYDDPALTGVYKLASIQEGDVYRDTYKGCVSDKTSWPGHQAIRRYTQQNLYAFDMIYDQRFGITSPISLPFDGYQELHVPLMHNGKKIHQQNLQDIRTIAHTTLAGLPQRLKCLASAKHAYPVYFDANIAHKKTGSLTPF